MAVNSARTAAMSDIYRYRTYNLNETEENDCTLEYNDLNYI